MIVKGVECLKCWRSTAYKRHGRMLCNQCRTKIQTRRRPDPWTPQPQPVLVPPAWVWDAIIVNAG